MDSLIKDAIDASLSGDFKKAIDLNLEILKKSKNSVECLNRLGCAYLETGQLLKAKKIYNKALLLDPCNPIILRCLKKIANIKSGSNKKRKTGVKLNNLFLSEPGKTKIASLINLAPYQTFSNLASGTPVFLVQKRRNLFVYLNCDSSLNKNNKSPKTYLGALPDDLSFRLIKLLKSGNLYEVSIRSISSKNITVFIKESFRTKKSSGQPSFLE